MYAERDFSAALIKFTSAYAASKDPRLLWNMASCEEKRRHYTKALALLRSFVREGGAVSSWQEAQQRALDGRAVAMDVHLLVSGVERNFVVHAYPDGRAPGRERLEGLELPYKVVPAPATSEDVALLVAAEKGASLIVTVGSHFNLVEFLDKNRAGMSSTFLTRLRVGEILVDAKGVSRLYRPSAGRGPIAALVLAAFATFVVVIATSPRLGQLLDLLWLKIEVLLGLK